jgi:hypothetical protein
MNMDQESMKLLIDAVIQNQGSGQAVYPAGPDQHPDLGQRSSRRRRDESRCPRRRDVH